MKYEFDTIGTIHSCFTDKFGIPRQPGLVPEATAVVELLPPYNVPEAVRGLEGFSHIWITFVFHALTEKAWSPTVRPPRLGGNRRIGVFASRSPVRPNPLGLSLVRLEQVDCDNGVRLHLSGVDFLDGTPVLDIKPYLPYVECIVDARGGYAVQSPSIHKVRFTPAAEKEVERLAEKKPGLKNLIIGLLQQDPRPGYCDADSPRQQFAMRLLKFDVHWRLEGDEFVVFNLVPLSD